MQSLFEIQELNNMKKIISIFIILTMLITPVLAEEKAITISGGEIETGEEIAIVISVPNVPAAIGSITLSYDNRRLEPVKSEFSSDFEAISPLINLKYADNQIKFNWMTLSDGINFNDCVTVTFKGIAGGENKVEVIQADLYDINETKIDIASVSEQINVIGEPPAPDEPVDTPDNGNSSSGSVNTGSSNSSGSGSVNHGTTYPLGTSGSSGSNKGSSTVKVPTNTTPAVGETTATKKSFKDTESVSWAEESIEFLAGKGIINGVSDTEFAPQNNIKRADYMILLVKMLGLDENFEDNFDDVASDKYYYNAIGIAKKMQLTSGVGDNKFNPEKSITRQEMFVMAYRILEMQNAELETAEVSELEVFGDYSMIAEYALAPLAVMVKNKLVSGSDGNIMPLGNATRAETAVLIKRLYDVINK